jgi:hypothetical protein
MAPETPWSIRAPINSSIEGARPQAAEAATKSPVPSENIRRRPHWSPSRVEAMRSELNVRPYPATTHSRPLSEAWRSRCIDGRATLTMKKSRITRKVPPIRTAKGAQPGSSTASSEGFWIWLSVRRSMGATVRSPVGGESSV